MTLKRHFPRFRDSPLTKVKPPKYTPRKARRRRPQTESSATNDKVYSNGAAMGDWKAEMTKLRRQYRQETSEIGEKAGSQEHPARSSVSSTTPPSNGLPSIESLSQYAWRDLSAEEKENVRIQKENNRKSHQTHAKEERLRSLLDFYHSSNTYAVNSEQLERKINEEFKEHSLGMSKYFSDPLAGEGIPLMSMKDARLRVLTDALGGFSSHGKVGEREVGGLLEKLSTSDSPDIEEPREKASDGRAEDVKPLADESKIRKAIKAK